ncbi:MAG: DUF6695 family protein [Flavobacteriales bacterium]
MKSTGKIISIAYPDTFVKHSNEWQCKVLPFLGLGTKDYIKAGHAALILINNKTGTASYFDFGRYITPFGYGRVRGANTDAELKLPIKAIIKENKLINLNKFLLWLDANPQKTHGEGRLLASICDDIDYHKAETKIQQLQQKGSIPYGAFIKNGCNCSRFVTEVLIEATFNETFKNALKKNKKFTPSTIGNVEKSASSEVFEVSHGVISKYQGSAFKENLTNYFKKKKENLTTEKSKIKLPKNAQLLTGIGSSAWFELVSEKLPLNYYRIKKYNDLHQIDFDGVYKATSFFIASKPYQFTYDSHCEYCHVLQEEKKIKLKFVETFKLFSSKQQEHLV